MTDIKWEVLKSWPANVHIHDIEGIAHPLTPVVIRELCEKKLKGLEVVVWLSPSENLLGVKAGISEHVFVLKQIRRIYIIFTRPGKGAGHISHGVDNIDNTGESIATSKSFSDEALVWLRSITESITTLTKSTVTIEEDDEGFDV